MVLTPIEIHARLQRLGIRADKYLGQHFLIHQAVLEAIIVHAKTFIQPKDTLVEAGPGLGVLTQELVQFKQPVIVVEKDPLLAQKLAEFLQSPKNLTVIQGNILDTSLDELKSWSFIANIPYAITSPLLRKLVALPNPPHDILVLVQKEAAERICAQPGDRNRGFLTVEIEVMAAANIIQFVSKTAFWPEPEVESALLHLKVREKPLIEQKEWSEVKRVVTAGFSAKRKQLGNSLNGGLALPGEIVKKALEIAQIDPTRRAETLSIDEWRRLTKELA
jgi:16S rRNA (adenine1518-N6/adenine1519-N6)-dimethyltransferase